MNNDLFPLWVTTAPGSLGKRSEDIPSIRLFPPSAPANGAAMLVFPGGGYEALMDYEGEAYAAWLAKQGYFSAVVHYRLTPNGYTLPTIVRDGVRAMRWMRSKAGELGFNPAKIGVIGSSAGGHLCANLAVHWDRGDEQAEDPVERCGSRPDLAVLCYPLIDLSVDEHWVSRFFGGQMPSKEIADHYSASRNVRKETAPCFLFHTFADETVPDSHSLRMANALAENRVPFEIHLYERGPHGLALGNGHPWTLECLRWLKERFELK
jgi:acetyl esterase/lipase